MDSTFNFDDLKSSFIPFGQYERYLSFLTEKKRYDVQNIKEVIEKTLSNLKENKNSFIIYGEPQSGKTEMMISLTSKLLDEGFKTIIVLITDHLPLLNQNLFRFKNASINPSPRNYKEIMDDQDYPLEKPLVIFCKKNSQDLKRLINKLSARERKVIIDDEADYATPNSKINLDEVSVISDLTGKLISEGGIYIGVTATPARLDLNNTHKNNPSAWIEYRPYSNYVGQDVFFPANLDKDNLKFRLTFLSEDYDQDCLKDALFNFLISSAHLNIVSSNKGYSMLIHTSGKRSDHSDDKKYITEILNKLSNPDPKVSSEYYKNIWEKAEERYKGEGKAIANYIAYNINKCESFLLNSDRDKSMDSNNIATNPISPFTIVFGGNIASRGVTFERLLSMFFTRGVKRTFHQDTYIQRARMFGSRKDYLDHFELVIPEDLYLNWQSCFVSHRCSLILVRNGNVPVWIHTLENTPTGKNSMDQKTVVVMGNGGEMGFELFNYDHDFFQNILKLDASNIDKLKEISKKFGDVSLPPYLIQFIESSGGNDSIAIRQSVDISSWTSDLIRKMLAEIGVL